MDISKILAFCTFVLSTLSGKIFSGEKKMKSNYLLFFTEFVQGYRYTLANGGKFPLFAASLSKQLQQQTLVPQYYNTKEAQS
jgi:hypothetical protein